VDFLLVVLVLHHFNGGQQWPSQARSVYAQYAGARRSAVGSGPSQHLGWAHQRQQGLGRQLGS
jgi:hypothetical protein